MVSPAVFFICAKFNFAHFDIVTFVGIMAGVITLTAEKRNVFGKKLAKERTAGKLPVVVYGPKDSSESYFVETAVFKKVYRQAGESSVITFDAAGTKKDVLIHEVTFQPSTGEPVHVDFYAIEKGKKINVNVPLRFEGEAPAIKLEGIVVKVLHEVEIEAMPANLPHELVVDLTKLETLESQITVSDLPVPMGVEVLTSGEEVIASITVDKEEEEAPVVMDISQIEVEKKGKKEEEGTEGATEPAE